MLVLNEFYILNLEVALVANRKPVGTLRLLDVLIKLLPSENSILGALVGAFEKVFGALALQVVQVIVVGELAVRAALLTLKCHLVENFLNYQGMQLCTLILNLTVRTISVAYLLRPEPFFYTVFAEPLFAL